VIAQAAPVVPTTNAPSFVPTTIPLALKGISGTKAQPLALVNNATLALGEAAEIRSAGHPVKVLLREVRTRSVLIEIVATGELRELKLREGI
jgi:hypothetical protein